MAKANRAGTTLLGCVLLGMTVLAPGGAQVIKEDQSQTGVVLDGIQTVRTFTVGGGDIPVGYTNKVADVSISIDFDMYNDDPSAPPYYSDLGLWLKGPNGKTVTLLPPNVLGWGAPGDLFSGILTFNDSSPNVIVPGSDTLLPGTLRPFESLLSAFGGSSALGDWRLTIGDAVSGVEMGGTADPTVYYGSTLEIWMAKGNVVTPPGSVPEPGPVALLLGVGTAGAMFYRRGRPGRNLTTRKRSC